MRSIRQDALASRGVSRRRTPATAGRARAIERLDLVKQKLNVRDDWPIVQRTAAGHRRIGGPRTRQRAAVFAEHADHADRVDAKDEAGRPLFHARTDDFGREPRSRRRVRPGVGNLCLAQDSAIDADGRFQRFGAGLPRAPVTRTRSVASSSTITSVMSSTTSGAR